MAYTKEELLEQAKAIFKSESIEGDLPDLISKFASWYLYIHQAEDLSQGLENSFSKSRKLNSRITHAADNYYSVFRGQNRIITLSELCCQDVVNTKKFDEISTYGDYKLYFSQDYSHDALSESFTFNAYLALDCKTQSIQGKDKLYLDIDDSDISEDIQIIRDSDGYEFKLSSKITDLYNEDKDQKADLCVMTMPNYTVRIWSTEIFLSSESYTIKYLKSPDKSIKDLDLNDIKSIPNFIKSGNTEIVDYRVRVNKLDDNDKIYLYAANNVKFNDTMKSNNSIRLMIEEFFPEFLGFEYIIEDDTIKVYYTTDYDQSAEIIDTKVESFNNKTKAYYIKQKFEFYKAELVEIATMEVNVTYIKEIDFSLVDTIIKSYQANIGKNFNPYQLIADLIGNDDLVGKVKLIELPQTQMVVTPLTKKQRIHYTNLSINYIAKEI